MFKLFCPFLLLSFRKSIASTRLSSFFTSLGLREAGVQEQFWQCGQFLLLSLLLSEGRTIVKCICESGSGCECSQSGRRIVIYPKPVAMSTTSVKESATYSVSALLLFLATSIKVALYSSKNKFLIG